MPVSILFPLPITRECDPFGSILGGGLLTTTQAGSDVPLATFQDVNCTVPNPNPVVLDATARAFVRYLPQAYKLKLTDQAGTVQWTVDNFWPPVSTEPVSALTFISGLLNPITPAEITAAVTPTNLRYPQGHPLRYGAVLDGITDDTIALQQWAKVPGTHTFPGAMASTVSNTITLVSNSKYEFGEGSTIICTQQDISILQATSQNNITIRGAKLNYPGVGTLPNLGGIAFITCNDCLIEDCEFSGMQFAGIYAPGALRCTFRNNYFHDCLGTMQNSADIYVSTTATKAASYNVIEGNQCFGGSNQFGIACWDPDIGTLPTHNIISNNRIANHNGYGILIYMPDAGNSYNQIIGNSIENISAFLGLPTPNTDSGAGIYLAGQGIGGTQIIGNSVRNCCITTTTASLAPAGIGINGVGSTGVEVPILIQGNMVAGMTRFHSMLITGWQGGASVTGNIIRHSIQTGSTIGDGIRIANCTDVSVVGNTIFNANTLLNQEGITLAALGGSNTNIVVSGNTIDGGSHAAIRTLQTAGGLNSTISITGNICTGGDSTCTPLIMDSASVNHATIANNQFNATAAVACITMAACTAVRFLGNVLSNTSGVQISFTGANTGSVWDMSNSGPTGNATVNNAGSGLVVSVLGTAQPTLGTWAQGDTVRQSAPTASNPYLWACTAGGTSGTWKTLTLSA